jgi:adenylylsulfate kinase
MNNLHKHNYQITQEDRQKLLKQKSAVIWLTGLSGSGKSTIANLLAQELHKNGNLAYVLDGDNVRMGLNKDLGFSDEDRTENIRRISEVAKLMSDSGVIVITAFISPFQADRESAREICGDNFIEVYVNASLDTCEGRDPKGLYEKARAGIIPNFTGIDSPYEEPIVADLELVTDEKEAIESTQELMDYLVQKNIIQGVSLVSTLDKRKTLAIDFDGVIHDYSQGFKGLNNAYDKPKEGTRLALESLRKDGFVLKILSSRPKATIEEWLKKWELDDLIDGVSNHKFPATLYIDDRGFHFTDWQTALEDIYNHPKVRK